MISEFKGRMAFVYPITAGIGGWGLFAATAIHALAPRCSLTAVGPGFVESWALSAADAQAARWIDASYRPSIGFLAKLEHRLRPGRGIDRAHRDFGSVAAKHVEALNPTALYTFTHVGLESLRWAKHRGIPTFLDNPNTHLADYRDAVVAESQRYGCGVYRGYPTAHMVDRVAEEFELADYIRVSSSLSKRMMVARGVPAEKIFIIPQPFDLESFRPVPKVMSKGRLRLCFVGSIDLRKGFVPLLQAIRRLGPDTVEVEMVGNTGDSCSKRLLRQQSAGLKVCIAAGDPRPAYGRAELFVLPSLEDGFGFVVAEALASGLPVIVTNRCGAAEWVRPGETGWIVPAGNVDALADALGDALRRRAELPEMGIAARRSVEERSRENDSVNALADWCLSKSTVR